MSNNIEETIRLLNAGLITPNEARERTGLITICRTNPFNEFAKVAHDFGANLEELGEIAAESKRIRRIERQCPNCGSTLFEQNTCVFCGTEI